MVKRKFRLQPALSHKERLKEICQSELAKVEAAFVHEHSVLKSLSQLESTGWEEIERKHALGELDLGAIGLHLQDLQVLEQRIERQRLVLDDLEETTRQKRDKLIGISKEKKVLEKLKVNHEKKIARDALRAEDKVMGDIATSQFHRRSVD